MCSCVPRNINGWYVTVDLNTQTGSSSFHALTRSSATPFVLESHNLSSSLLFESEHTTMSSEQKRRESIETHDEESALPLLETSEKDNVLTLDLSKLRSLKLLISSVHIPPISSFSPSTPLHLRLPAIGNNSSFIIWTVINTLATIGIVQFFS